MIRENSKKPKALRKRVPKQETRAESSIMDGEQKEDLRRSDLIFNRAIRRRYIKMTKSFQCTNNSTNSSYDWHPTEIQPVTLTN